MTLDQAQNVQQMALQFLKLLIDEDTPAEHKKIENVMALYNKIHEDLVNSYPEKFRPIR